MRQQEFPHNTPEQVREYVSQALALVEELNVPEDLRGVAFNVAVNLYSSKQVVFEQMPSIPNLGVRH